MKIIYQDSFIFMINEKDKYVFICSFEKLLYFIYENSKTFKRLPTYEFELFNNKYNSISQERIIRDLFDTIESMKDEEECEFNLFDEYKFKIKVIRIK